MGKSKVFDYSEVKQHGSASDCWVVLYNKVYNVTSFLSSHPGGQMSIMRLAGTDATEEYDPIHPPGTLEENLPKECFLGEVDEKTLPAKEVEESAAPTKMQHSSGPAVTQQPDVPSLDACLNLDDIERLATSKISARAWAYYFSASDDLITKSYNNLVYQKILLRPRVFIDCTHCSLDTSLLQNRLKLKLPIYVSPAAQARLCHPAGEAGIAQACAKFGALQVISNNASLSPEQIIAASPTTSFGFQIYVQDTRAKSEEKLARIAKLPQIKFLVLTLDAPVPGKREHDERRSVVNTGAPSSAVEDPLAAAASAAGGVGRALFAGTATDLTWRTTLPWLAKHTKLPIVLKGVQTHEDVLLASRHPQVQAVILSNHGGRALDTAPPAVHVLLEVRKYCPEVFGKLEVWVDGGIKRGTDVVKALALGAKAVGIGRGALFGLGAGGREGVEKVLGILQAETLTCMRLLGVETIEELGPQHVNARRVEQEIYDGPSAAINTSARL